LRVSTDKFTPSSFMLGEPKREICKIAIVTKPNKMILIEYSGNVT